MHFADINKVPRRSVALLLGTNKYTLLGSENEYYTRRIDAVAELYKARKIDSVLISGDNSSKEYNEPEMMLADLEAVGIPKSRCLLDYGGRRTL
ncbi:MAG: YdcF family protein, partial [Bacteroidaceae bacterium]|nr:YdcF family protein [Bacteroidaceae bacterium]